MILVNYILVENPTIVEHFLTFYRPGPILRGFTVRLLRSGDKLQGLNITRSPATLKHLVRHYSDSCQLEFSSRHRLLQLPTLSTWFFLQFVFLSTL